MFRLYLILLTLALFVAVGPVAGQESATPKDVIPLLSEEQEAKLDQAHEDTSQWLLSKAAWFDNFFDT